MTRVELPHDKGLYGPLRAAAEGRPELVRIGALIEALADGTERARADAARIVLERITAFDLFKLNTQGDATPVTASDTFNLVWPSGYGLGWADQQEPAANLCQGSAGALRAMGKHWACEVDSARSWAHDECAWLAILRTDAEVAFPEVFGQAEQAQASAPAPSIGKTVLQPAGGAWPHSPSRPWTDAERWALFEMRHRLKFTGPELARIARVSRQRVDEVIGPAKPHGGLGKIVAKDGAWSPPPELLARVGAPLQPLQAAAAALAAA